MMKSINLVIALALGLSANIANANKQSMGNYKLAVIEGKAPSRHVLRGDYTKAINAINQGQQKSATAGYESSMSLCAAKIKMSEIEAALKACDNAVIVITDTDTYQTDKDKYKALALSNRAVAKQLNNDYQGAYQDFTSAMALTNQQFILDNFYHFSTVVAKAQFEPK